jgi:UTRA domain
VSVPNILAVEAPGVDLEQRLNGVSGPLGDLGGGYALDRLEEAGHGPMTWTEIGRVRMPSREEAALLDISTAVPVLELTRVGVSARTSVSIEATGGGRAGRRAAGRDAPRITP